MRIRKGDLVHVLSGKDRGKQGRVIDARPKAGKIVVENLNIVKRHTKPRPIQNTSRMGGAGMTPGGVVEKPAPLPAGNVMIVCPNCDTPTRIATVSPALPMMSDSLTTPINRSLSSTTGRPVMRFLASS